MRDALGGTVTLFIISVFIVLALGYLAFNVNYTKAFRMKDKIVSVYETYNGCNGSGDSTDPATCQDEIEKYATKIGYKPDNFSCSSGEYKKIDNLYCVRVVDASGKTSAQKASDPQLLPAPLIGAIVRLSS